jgi:peptide/nickel transport system substrate-binding protein
MGHILFNERQVVENFKEARLNLRHGFILFLMALLTLTSSCTPDQPVQPVVPTPPVAATVTELPPTPLPTAVPERSLVICLGEEPISLYPYGYNSRTMWSILESIYDGPFDTINFESQAVIMQGVPAKENGDLRVESIAVSAGDAVLNTAGNVVTLTQGTEVYPAGCQEKNCTRTWDGSSELLMEQTVITYRMLPDLVWSDGEPLTAQDSVFSYQIAKDPQTPVNRYYVDRTASYRADDSQTVVWQGIAGYDPATVSETFWLPLPQHQLGSFSAAELLEKPEATRSPLGWGAYQIDEWVFGDHLSLSKNPYYFKAGQNLPHFDKLVFRFLGPHADSNLKALEIGECDLIDASVQLDEQLVDVVEGNNLGTLKAWFGQGPEWEHLDFGIVPASYDDGIQPNQDRPDWFTEPRMRQAIAYCTDRETIANRYFVNRSTVPVSFYPPSHPAFNHNLQPLAYDPAKGQALLEALGWRDDDQNPATPRVAYGVSNVLDGTPLMLNYITTQSELRVAASYDYAVSLAGCGIQVNLQQMLPTDLYAQGPEGLMFGRNFDLAQFAWTTSRNSPCSLYTSAQIPNADNLWIGANISGYQNPAFDTACETVLTLSPADGEAYRSAQQNLQQIFFDDLPVLPLYYHLKSAAGRVDFCGFDALDVSARSVLWNLENYDYGTNCQ